MIRYRAILTRDVPAGDRIYREGTIGTITISTYPTGSVDHVTFNPDVGQQGFLYDVLNERPDYYTGDFCLLITDGPDAPAVAFCQPCDLQAGCCHHSVLVTC